MSHAKAFVCCETLLLAIAWAGAANLFWFVSSGGACNLAASLACGVALSRMA